MYQLLSLLLTIIIITHFIGFQLASHEQAIQFHSIQYCSLFTFLYIMTNILGHPSIDQCSYNSYINVFILFLCRFKSGPLRLCLLKWLNHDIVTVDGLTQLQFIQLRFVHMMTVHTLFFSLSSSP